jgi:hypothetical protein
MLIITNNPMAQAHLLRDGAHEVSFHAVSLRELLVVVRDRVHLGHRLLTHPLSGSVKPNETCYKSIAITPVPEAGVCVDSLLLIEDAIAACDKFAPRDRQPDAQMLKDFQLVDWTLMQSALTSA